MTDKQDAQRSRRPDAARAPGDETQPLSSTHERTGQDRLLRNVLSSWSTQVVLVIMGFVVPRIVDEHIGQFSLGIWDFCWSIVNYLHLSSLGVGSSVNRYVARFRAWEDWHALNVSIASVSLVQLAIAAFVVIAVATVVYVMPIFFAERLEPELDAARYVAAFLGGSVAVQMLFDPARGVITGCHRWDIYNWLNVGSQFTASVGMIIALVAGGGLRSMAIVYFCTVVVAETLRVYIAHRVCPEARLDYSLARRSRAKEMTKFGLKSALSGAPQIVAFQTSSIIIAGALGPAALAVFARSIALIRHTSLFLQKFANVLTPTASSMQGLGEEESVRELLLSTTRYAVALVFPALAFLAVDGDMLLELWMGEDYVNHALIVILALGFALPIAQTPAIKVVAGMNQHGRIGAISLVIVVTMFTVGYFVGSAVGWRLEAVALLLACPLILSDGLTVPYLCCRRLGVRYATYLRYSILEPAVLTGVFALLLWLGRHYSHTGMELLGSVAVSSLVLAMLYWNFLLGDEARLVLRKKIPFARPA